MKFHRPLVSEVVAALSRIFGEGALAEQEVARLLKSQRKWGARDRRFVAENVYDLVRWWRWYWHLAGLPEEEYLDRETLTEQRVWAVWAAYCLQTHGELPPFIEVSTVDAQKLAHRATLPGAPAVTESFPDWLDERCAQELGEIWAAERHALNLPADVYLRVNTLRADAASVVAALAEEGIAAERVPHFPHALKLTERRSLQRSRAFAEGLFEVQDLGSQQIAALLDPQPGETVIDACAGAGGKTLHLGCLMRNRGRLLALDVHEWKLCELQSRAERAGLKIVESRPAGEPLPPCDRLLLDVPCSGLGVLRRHPDTKWKLTPSELDRLISLQREILLQTTDSLRPGGILVYATCSLLPSENQRQVEWFLRHSPSGWELQKELILTPAQHGTDGFYAARLMRSR